MAEAPIYRAFFSYSRGDDRIANWLWQQLDRYRVPHELVGLGQMPRKLYLIFRDARPAHDGLPDLREPNLRIAGHPGPPSLSAPGAGLQSGCRGAADV